jgi:hypothetical protein
MAITYVGASSAAYSSASTQTAVVGKPSGITSGDIMFALICRDMDTSFNTPPSGWTDLLSTVISSSKIWLYYRVATSADVSASDYTWTFYEGGHIASGVIFAYRGQAGSSFIHDTSNTSYSTFDKIVRAGDITTTVPTHLIFFGQFITSTDRGRVAPPDTPGAFTERWDAGDTTCQYWPFVSDYYWSGTGTAGNIDASGLVDMTAKHAFAVALKAAPLATGVTLSSKARILRVGTGTITPKSSIRNTSEKKVSARAHLHVILYKSLVESLSLTEGLLGQDILDLIDRIEHRPIESGLGDSLTLSDVDFELLKILGASLSEGVTISDAEAIIRFMRGLHDTITLSETIEFTKDIHIDLTDFVG